jgi:predicted glycosyltransferase
VDSTEGARRRPGVPSVAYYIHEGLGLGHLKRTLKIAGALRARWPDIAQLIVTGNPVAHDFVLGDLADYIKLPAVRRIGADDAAQQFSATHLPLDFEQVLALRGEMLAAIARNFQPDVVIVDRMPAGLEGELVSSLHIWKKLGRTMLVYGLRDILNDASQVRRVWEHDEVYDLIDNVYDRVFVYGQREICDVVGEYGLSLRAAAKVRYVGYLGQEVDRQAAAAIRARIGSPDRRLVLVTAGGGLDGLALFQLVLRSLRLNDAHRFDWLLVGGPLMPEPHRAEITADLPRRPSVRFLEAVQSLPEYLAAADVVVSMAGYNTVCEILSVGRPAVILPRLVPNAEQLLRTEALSRRGLLRMVHPMEATPERLLDEVARALDEPPGQTRPIDLGGLHTVCSEMAPLLERVG